MIDFDGNAALPDKPLFSYFRNNATSFWDFQSYINHCLTGKHHPPREKTIKNNYRLALSNMIYLPNLNEEIKDYLNSLLNDEVTENKEVPRVTQYINYGRVNHQGPSINNITHSHCNRNSHSTNNITSDNQEHFRRSSTKRYVVGPRHYEDCEQQYDSPFSSYQRKFTKFQKVAAIESRSEAGKTVEDDLIIVVRNLVERLPKRKVASPTQESNLSTTYVDAVFRPMLEDPDENVHLKWSNVSINNESSLRPDFTVQSLNNITTALSSF
ncbi:unnamed protein product [Mucor fragilis]